MTTSSTVNCKSYYIQNADNFNLFCAAALAGVCANPQLCNGEQTARDLCRQACLLAESMMLEFQERRMAGT